MDAAFGRKEGNLRDTWSGRLDPHMGPGRLRYRIPRGEADFRQSELFELVLASRGETVWVWPLKRAALKLHAPVAYAASRMAAF